MPTLTKLLIASSLIFTLTACGASELPSPVPEARASLPPEPLALEVIEPPPVEEDSGRTTLIEVIDGVGLSRPVAALHDPTSDVYLVANAPQGDSPAFIASPLPEGDVDQLRWIDGSSDEVQLREPAAMAIVRKRLVVSDGQHLRVFDREHGTYRGSIHVPSAFHLADIAVGPRGDLFVTDSGQLKEHSFGTVFRVNRKGKVSPIARSSVLGRPTGVLTRGLSTWITATDPEAFYALNAKGKLTHGASVPVQGAFAGLVWAEDTVVFSSPKTRALYAGPLEGPFEAIATAIDVSGDLGWDANRRRLLVPCAEGDRLEFHLLAPAS